MSTTDIPEISAIESALKERPEATITGSQLLALISSAAPTLDIRAQVGIPRGPGALTGFARQYLSKLVERIGNQGGDVLYRIDGRDIGDVPPSGAYDLWRTFVSPSSPQRIILNRSLGRLASRDTPATADDEIEIPKASAEEHDEIRAAFPASLSEAEAAIIKEHVTPNVEFASWMTALKTYLPEAIGKWGLFRRRKLSALLNARIFDLGLEKDLQQSLLAQTRAAEQAAYDRPKASNVDVAPQPGQHAKGPDKIVGITERARLLAHATVDFLSYDELRALKMPLGAMFDAIRAER